LKSYTTHLECSLCARTYPVGTIQNLCQCGGPLLVRYDLAALRQHWSKADLQRGPNSMWRYAPALPVSKEDSIVSLGEGMTPLLAIPNIGRSLGATNLWLKDEGLDPTGSFKARGMACAISMAVELGIRKIALPSAGNAGSAAAIYAARAGIEAHIFMPRDVPQSNYVECKAAGAHVTLVDGLINDCGKIVASRKEAEGWFEVSTQKEPYRVEGKKTMAYEFLEQLDWQVPDAILYPTGGGVGLIGMWKAFDELEALGWIGGKRPKMIAVQAEGCQPVVQAFEKGEVRAQLYEKAATVASGLRVPKPLGDFLILEAVRASEGTAIAIPDHELLQAGADLASEEGVFVAPEGAACIAAVRHLLQRGNLKPEEQIIIYNTGSGLKYLEAYSALFPRAESRKGQIDQSVAV
jgi:threonine synthase